MTMRLVNPKSPGLPEPPPDRGRLLKAEEVADIIGGVSQSWVRRKVPHAVKVGHSIVRWYELDVRAWLEANRLG